jgi:outer membrane protein TolC
MSRRLRAALVAPLLLASASRAFSQESAAPAAAPGAGEVVEVLSFEEAVGRAVTRNPSVGEASQAILQAKSLLDRTRTVFYPLVYGDIGTAILDDARGFNGSVVTPQTQTRFSATVSYAFLDAVRWANRSQARDRVRTAQIAADQTRQQVAVAAASAYLAVIGAERQLDITERNLETARALEEYARARLEAGQGSRLNHVRSVQQRGSAEALVEIASLSVRRAQEALGVAVFADGPVGVRGEPVLLPARPPADDAWLQARPDVRLFTSELDARDRIVSDAWKSWLPTVTGSFTPLYVTPNGLFEPSRSWRAFFSLQVPIFDGTLGADRAFKIAERDAARFRLAGTVAEARSQVRVSQESVARAERAVAVSRQAADNASEALRITEIAYRAGATTNIEVVQAQQTARQAEIEAAAAEDRLRQFRLDLLVALGQFP